MAETRQTIAVCYRGQIGSSAVTNMSLRRRPSGIPTLGNLRTKASATLLDVVRARLVLESKIIVTQIEWAPVRQQQQYSRVLRPRAETRQRRHVSHEQHLEHQ